MSAGLIRMGNVADVFLMPVFVNRDTDTRFSSDTDFSEDPDGKITNPTKGKVTAFPFFTF